MVNLVESRCSCICNASTEVVPTSLSPPSQFNTVGDVNYLGLGRESYYVINDNVIAPRFFAVHYLFLIKCHDLSDEYLSAWYPADTRRWSNVVSRFGQRGSMPHVYWDVLTPTPPPRQASPKDDIMVIGGSRDRSQRGGDVCPSDQHHVIFLCRVFCSYCMLCVFIC